MHELDVRSALLQRDEPPPAFRSLILNLRATVDLRELCLLLRTDQVEVFLPLVAVEGGVPAEAPAQARHHRTPLLLPLFGLRHGI